MGFFDKFRKNKEQDNNEQKENIVTEKQSSDKEGKPLDTAKEKASEAPKEKSEVKLVENIPGMSSASSDGTHFVLLVEDIIESEGSMDVMAVGFVHGEIKVTDVVYIIQPAGKISLSSVESIEVIETESKRSVSTAKEQRIGIRFSNIKNKEALPKLTVLTNIRPQTVVDANTGVQNPQLLGLLYEYTKMRESNNTDYLNLLIFSVCRSRYIVPVHLDNEPVKGDDGKAVFTKGTKISFPTLRHPQNEKLPVLPLFTDWEALGRWKNVFDQKHPPKTMILNFPDAVKISTKGSQGIAVNPFGPMSLMLPPDMIKMITNTAGYKRDFGEGAKVNRLEEIKAEKGSQIMVGAPKETDEVRLIKEAIATFAKNNEDIKQAYLLIKLDKGKTRTYFCVVDCPEEKARQIFGDIFNAVGAYLNEIKSIDFTTFEKSKFMHNALNDTTKVF